MHAAHCTVVEAVGVWPRRVRQMRRRGHILRKMEAHPSTTASKVRQEGKGGRKVMCNIPIKKCKHKVFDHSKVQGKVKRG